MKEVTSLVADPLKRFEIPLDLLEVFAVRFRHPKVTEHGAQERNGGITDEVNALVIRVRHRLVRLQHHDGRERDGEYDRGVGQAARVRREVLALDDG